MYLLFFYVNMFLVMIMKKFISIFLTLTVLLLSFSVSAFANDPVTLSIQNEKVYAGDTFTVNVFISDNSQVSGAVIDINYDKNMLEFVSAKEGGILDTKANISIRNIKNDKSYVRFIYMSGSSAIDSEGILFTVTFKALETAKGKTNLEITVPNPADFVNSSLEKLEYKTDNAEIVVLDNISIETTESTTAETTTNEEKTEATETETNEPIITIGAEDNDKDNTKTLLIVLLLVGVALILIGTAFVIKKKK